MADIVSNAQALASKLNAPDFIWIAGAVVLGFLAIKIAFKVLKVVLIVGALLLLLGFAFTSGLIPT
jgi:hypothetical protein